MDWLGKNWFALVLLVTAAGLLIRTRFGKSLASRPWSAAGAHVLGSLGFGGMLLTGVSLDFVGYTFSLSWLFVIQGLLWLSLAIAVLLVGRVWSFWLAVVLSAVLLLGLGGWTVQPLGKWIFESAKSVRALEFVRPLWLGLLVLVPLVFWISRKSLSGLGPVRRRVAITARALGVAALALALAEPRLRQNSESLTVLYVVDRSFSIPQDLEADKASTEAKDLRWERVRDFIQLSVANRPITKRNDKSGLILFGKRPKLALPPDAVDRLIVDERTVGPVDANYTDIAAALKLALASFPEGTSKRIVLVSDGNENLGNSEEQANIAKQNGVQIDAIALAPGFKNESEVLVQSVEAPSVSAQGQRLPVRVLIRNATPDREVDGRLEVVKASTGQNKGIEIEDGPQVLEKGPPPKVRLRRGLNVFRFQDRLEVPNRPGQNREGVELDLEDTFAYRATFIPTESRSASGDGNIVAGLPGDRAANNRASAAIVTRGERRVLFLDENEPGTKQSSHAHLLAVMGRAGIKVSRMPIDDLPAEKTILGGLLSKFDCVVLGNVAADRFNFDQMELLRSNVYDQGCGLIMIGGPDSFGAGGYQATPVEAALPVDCEIKALKAAGKGGLILIMHASEMADGNKWQKDIAKLAVQRLGPADMVGVLQYGFGGGNGVSWQVPFQQVGESESGTRNRILSAIDRMTPGDMPDFDPFLKAAADTLSDEKHQLTVKHCILISDGDPNYSGPGRTAVKKMADNGITCSTVGVATHGGAEKSRLKQIAESTRDADGKPGNFYDVNDPSKLPAIYMKESRRVSQSFLYVQPFVPGLVGQAGASDVLPPGLPNPLPKLHGFVRTTLKQNILAGMSLEGPSPYPDQQFPVLASWRYGLGKAVAFTSDARTQPGAPKQWWDKDWVGSEIYQKFWEQLINWAMREPERGKMSLVAEYRDGRIRIVADIRDDKDKPVAGLNLRGAATPPNAPAQGEKAPQVEFKPKGGGLYEAEFAAEDAGSYFLNVQAMEPERDAKGNVVMNANGTPRMKTFDAARAGVTVPYSPEFSDLESNTPLMERLAKLTDGQFVLESDSSKMIQQANVFRDAPSTLKSLRPFWFWLVFAAAVLLLLDVGIRRISLESTELRNAFARFWGKLRNQEVSLEDDASLGRLLQRKAVVSAAMDKNKATRKFDPNSVTVAEPAPAGADEYAAKSGSPAETSRQPQRIEDKPEVDDQDDPLTRLKKAKQRAKHQQNKRDED
jgi:uncharacterized membrane protein